MPSPPKPAWIACLTLAAALATAGCDDDTCCIPDPPGSDGGADIDADAGGPRSLDADVADAADAAPGLGDADMDDTAELGFVETWDTRNGAPPGLCTNGGDDDDDGLRDCADPGCLTSPECCDALDRQWLQGDFATCADLPDCGWTSFTGQGDDDDDVRLEGGALVLGGDGVGEVGAVAEQEVGLTGEPTVAFISGLDESLCGPDRCWQVLGVALTAQGAPTAGTGVAPHVGLVLDGEQGAVHAWVGGRLVRTERIDRALLGRRGLHGFRVAADGRVDFWVGLDPALGTDPPRFDAAPTFSAPDAADVRTQGLRVAVFGRLAGDGAARVERIGMSRLVCDVPDAWARLSPLPVVPAAALNRVAAPAVVELASGGLLMVFDAGGTLEAAESHDRGRTWTRRGPLGLGQAPTQYGRVARRSPTLLWWGPEGEMERLHLWYEGEAERDATAPEGTTPTAICHAVSDDGVSWAEPEDSALAVVGSPVHPWRAEVGAPTVVATEAGALAMWFVGRAPATGAFAVLRATSTDAKVWASLDEVLLDNGAEAAPFERDGIAEPVVVRRGGAYHMWYEGTSGSRTTVGYAVSADGRRWQRWGPVFEDGATWEASRVGAPAVAAFLDESAAFETLFMWYEGGPPGRERVGLAVRDVPLR
jgi:hypothetical protein